MRRSPTSACPRASPSATRARRRRSRRRCRTNSSCSLAAVAAMYIVLGVLYESFVHPITILTTLPSAGIGALLTLELRRRRPRHHRRHRHRAADRHRQEERDHDDRLRPRRTAERGLTAARRDLSGLPAAPAADPDDDGRGDFRRAAADARDRRRLRVAPSARSRDRRRPRIQPGADALHDAGHLSVLRAARRAVRARRVRSALAAEPS